MAETGIVRPTDDEVVGFFMRHLVPVFFSFEKENRSNSMLMTAFVLSVGEQWFLVTAGHSIRQVERMTTEHGYRIANCYLIDSIGLGAKHPEPIPFIYAESHPTRMSESKSFDFGVMVLSAYYRELLEKNNVQALSEEVWKCHPPNPDFYALLGISGEFVTVGPEHVEITPTLHGVEAIDERPEGFLETDVPLFYGRIRLEQGMTSIKGMSGAPIFAFQQDVRGQWRYWLVALQSRWLPKSHYIAGCPTRILGEVLERVLSEYREHSSGT